MCQFSRFSLVVLKNLQYNGNGAIKNRQSREWSVDDFDATEIRRCLSTKSDGAGGRVRFRCKRTDPISCRYQILTAAIRMISSVAVACFPVTLPRWFGAGY